MDLKIYQRQMWLTLKKYLNLVAAKNEDVDHNKDINEELGCLLKKIVSINENQKIVLSILRKQRKISQSSKEGKEVSTSAFETSSDVGNCSPTGVEDSSPCPLQANNQHCLDRLFAKETSAVTDNKWGASDPSRKIDASTEKVLDEVHDLVTTEEYMHSIGLLTSCEYDDVIEKRRERYKRNAHSHIFCLAIWEKQETKRKRRDWLVSGSPPQLRRKIRPNSEPSSRQPSRGASPVEGSSSPTSSLSPPSPASPTSSPNHIVSLEEICPVCKKKGANVQCDGCGAIFHVACVDYFEDGDSMNAWICLKCEQLGLRTSTYIDPLHLHHNENKGREKRQIFLRR